MTPRMTELCRVLASGADELLAGPPRRPGPALTP